MMGPDCILFHDVVDLMDERYALNCFIEIGDIKEFCEVNVIWACARSCCLAITRLIALAYSLLKT